MTKKRASLEAGSGPRGGGKPGPKASRRPKAKANAKTGARRKAQAIASPQAPKRTGPEPKPVAAPSTVKLTPAPGPPPGPPTGPPRGEIEDAQLVVMAQAGDTRAFDELVRRYRDRVYRLSYKILRHEEDAAESLQDAFLSAFRGLKNFKAESTFSTWLYRIATNASLMKYRKRRDNHVSLEQSQSRNDDAEPLEVPDWSTQPVDELLTAETREVMEDSVARLPDELQTVFLMRDIQEQSNAEVAASLDLSVAAVKSRLHRARLLLRDRLNRYFADRMTKKDRVP